MQFCRVVLFVSVKILLGLKGNRMGPHFMLQTKALSPLPSPPAFPLSPSPFPQQPPSLSPSPSPLFPPVAPLTVPPSLPSAPPSIPPGPAPIPTTIAPEPPTAPPTIAPGPPVVPPTIPPGPPTAPQTMAPPLCIDPNESYTLCKWSCLTPFGDQEDFCPYISPEETSNPPTMTPTCPLGTREMCVEGCICKNGYARDKDYNCILKSSCTAGCGGDPYAEPRRCGDPCPITCTNMNYPNPGPCISKCSMKTNTFVGCACKVGYVIGPNKKCIPTWSCPGQCRGPNEVYVPCKNRCPETCPYNNVLEANWQPPQPIDCQPGRCLPGCDCIYGYVRDATNTCVLRWKCPLGCGGDPNAEVFLCGNPCPITCENKHLPVTRCTKPCIPYSCRCKTGYVLNSNGRCILPTAC